MRRRGAVIGLALLCSSSAGLFLRIENVAADSTPPAVVLAQGLSGTKVGLIWTARQGATSYKVYRNGNLIARVLGTSYENNGLRPLTSYQYQITTISGGVESTPSVAVATSTQAPTETSPPTEPGNVVVSSITATSAKLKWAKSTDNVAVEGYRIYRGAPGDTPAELDYIWTVDGFKNTYTATDLRSGTSYQFGVIALDPDNNLSPMRTVILATIGSTDTSAPTPPSSTSVSIKPFSSSRIDLTWGASTSPDVSSYLVLRDGSVVGSVDLPMRNTYSDNGLAGSTSYSYSIEAVDSARNASVPTTAKAGTTLPSGQVRIARGPVAQSTTATSARVVWWTNLPTKSVLIYTVAGVTTKLVDSLLTLRHVMLLGPLAAGTIYAYQVGDGTTFSQLATLTAAPPSGVPGSMAFIGDYGANSVGEAQNASLISTDATQIIQTVGDNIYPDSRDPDFATNYSDFDGRLFKQFQPAFMSKTFMTANGEKEYFGDGAFWRAFALPNNEQWFSYDWGDAHILVLDTERPYSPGSPQYAFAQADLDAHQGKAWRIVVLQNPPFSSTSSNSSSVPVQQYLVPLLQQEHVQLAISGNSHNYERSYPLTNGFPAAGGVTYVITGAGGNSFNKFTIPKPSWSAFREDTFYEYVRVVVSPTSLRLEAVKASDGTIFDTTLISAS